MAVPKLPYLPLTLSMLILLPAAALAQEVDSAAMIASALSAAPEAITAAATVTDLAGNVLHEGTSGFTCMPDDPDIPGNGPICLDAGWHAFIGAWMNHEEPPALEEPAFIYALQGGWPTSNVDPYATGPTEDNGCACSVPKLASQNRLIIEKHSAPCADRD
jgi:hypothetical protein